MIRLIEALNYRCLRYVRQPLADFQILVGPNASGKSTFMKTVEFLGHFVSDGLDRAISEQTDETMNFHDLLFDGQSNRFELAIELAVPDTILTDLPDRRYDGVRYEVAFEHDPTTNVNLVAYEELSLFNSDDSGGTEISRSPSALPSSIVNEDGISHGRPILRRRRDGNTFVSVESGIGEQNAGLFFQNFQFSRDQAALRNLPEDKVKFPVSTWLKGLLVEGISYLCLNGQILRQASHSGKGRRWHSDGGNLPWLVQELKSTSPDTFKEWLAHVQTSLPDLKGIESSLIPDLGKRYLRLTYKGRKGRNSAIPSWLVSEGTLRLLTLTLLPYLPHPEGIYLIEEPESGVHPLAIEVIYQSLRSMYGSQVLVATHSPVVLGCASPKDLLCFSKDKAGATVIVSGTDHPALKNWTGEISLGILHGSGVLE